MNSWVWFVIGAFCVGSFPFGLIIARAKGVDIRQHGSKNIGATNVMRVLGKGPGTLCFVLDVLKGLGPTMAAGIYHGVAGSVEVPATAAWWWLGVMAAAILGHIFSPWVGFRGGKGVATGLGALLGVWPVLTIPGLACFAVWIAVFAWKRYVSLASVVAAASLPLLIVAYFGVASAEADAVSGGPGAMRHAGPFLIVVGALCGVVVWRHRTNIGRLMRGEELRAGRSKPVS